jgi:hypothetical protein
VRPAGPRTTISRRRVAFATVGVVAAGLLAAGLGSAWADTSLTSGRPATGSAACNSAEAPGKAVNGTARGRSDKWCSRAAGAFLQVDLQAATPLGELVVKHAGAGGESARWNTRDFTLSVSTDGKQFTTVATVTGNTADTTRHPVAAVSARFIRLSVSRPTSTGDKAARIYELEAYAAKNPAPAPTVPATQSPTTPPTTAPTTAPTAAPTTVAPTKAPTTPPAPAACHSDAPATLTDHIGDHGTAMTRVSCDADVAVYFDADLRALPAAGTAWVAPFTAEVWRHIKDSYGACATKPVLAEKVGTGCERFGQPKPALAFYHQGKHQGGTVSNRFDAFANFRTTLDVGINGWRESDRVLHDMIVHEACHQVEGSSQGTHESPAFPIWGDSKWAEFCIYDFYVRSGRTSDADRVFKMWTAGRDNLPAGARSAAWFQDWFYPLWKENGGNAAVMQRFFGLLAQHFPKRSHNGGANQTYARRMNTGEFVLFTSAAAGKDLSGRAAQAFNTGFDPAQFAKAQRDFPGVTF